MTSLNSPMPPGSLPTFTDRDDHAKHERMQAPIPPPAYLRRFLESVEISKKGDTRILDVGCGRGDTVAWLLHRGFDAYGVDISEEYLIQGKHYLQDHGFDPDRLRLVGNDGSFPFESGSFGLLFSDQVIEHVPALVPFVSEIARVALQGSRGLHIFPARWRPLEVHLRMPLVHWLPKGRARALAINVALRCHLGARYFEDLTLEDRVRIFTQFSERQTFYRPLREVTDCLAAHGMKCDPAASAQHKIAFHLPALPHKLLGPAALLYRHAFSVVLHTERSADVRL